MIELIDAAFGIVTSILIPLAFGLCTLFFLWGIVKYIKSDAGNEKSEGRRIMLWGTVGLFVVFSIWGIIALIQNELGIPGIENVDKDLISSPTENIEYHL